MEVAHNKKNTPLPSPSLRKEDPRTPPMLNFEEMQQMIQSPEAQQMMQQMIRSPEAQQMLRINTEQQQQLLEKQQFIASQPHLAAKGASIQSRVLCQQLALDDPEIAAFDTEVEEAMAASEAQKKPQPAPPPAPSSNTANMPNTVESKGPQTQPPTSNRSRSTALLAMLALATLALVYRYRGNLAGRVTKG